MWLLTEDGGLLNLDRICSLASRRAGSEHVLVAEAGGLQVVVASGSEARVRELIRLIAREIDQDIVGVLDVRTGRGVGA
jgi:hypothetical protein